MTFDPTFSCLYYLWSTSAIHVSVSDSNGGRLSSEVMGEKDGPDMDSECCDKLSSELWGRAPREGEVS